jgi:hypothetical protein
MSKMSNQKLAWSSHYLRGNHARGSLVFYYRPSRDNLDSMRLLEWIEHIGSKVNPVLLER